jgi:hypothetical protein
VRRRHRATIRYARPHAEQGLRDVRDLSKPIQQELEKFFIATDELEDKKLEIRMERSQDRDEGDQG